MRGVGGGRVVDLRTRARRVVRLARHSGGEIWLGPRIPQVEGGGDSRRARDSTAAIHRVVSEDTRMARASGGPSPPRRRARECAATTNHREWMMRRVGTRTTK